MKQQSIAAASGLFIAALTASCGGGDSGASLAPASCATGQTSALADFFLPYLIGTPTTTLVAVNASDFTDKRTVAGSFGFQGSHVLTGSDVATGATANDLALSNRRPHSLLYIQGGKWFRAPLRKSDPALLTSVQISSETQADAICSIVTRALDLGAPAKDLVFYTLAGPDNNCGNGDDLRRLIHADTDAGTAPEAVTATALNSVVGFYTAQGLATGFLSFESSALKLYDQNFHNPASLASGIASYFVMAAGADFAIVQIDGTVRRVEAGGQISLPLHTTTSGFKIDPGPADGNNVYFTEANLSGSRQGKLFRLALNGLNPSVLMFEDTSNQILARGLTQGKVIFITNPPNQTSPATLSAIDKVAGAPLPIDAVSSGFFVVFSSSGPQGANVFYTRVDTATVQSFPSARERDDSGNTLLDFDHSVWAGEASGASTNKDNGFSSYPIATHLLLAQGLTNPNNGVNGATLKSYRVSDGKTQTLTTLAEPSGVGITALSTGPIGLGTLQDFTGSATHRDVFAFNLDNVAPPANYCRYVDTAGSNESPVP